MMKISSEEEDGGRIDLTNTTLYTIFFIETICLRHSAMI
jgi:hypothetical protein